MIDQAAGLRVDEDAIEAISSSLDLREPNREALRSIAYMLSQHVDVEHRPPPFEAVVDAATGVGKTYIIAAAIDYFAAQGHRNFAIVAPGRTILEKTIANFTAGHKKSLLGGMEVEPLVVTSENFATVDHAEPDRVRLYVFTVQSLVKPTGKQGRKTHAFHESLGEAFYAYLRELDDLILFADEHHVYYGPAFSDAIRDLKPHALIGLTATPHKKSEDQIIYRYPLAAAIADRLVKTPVLVGRKDDRGGETLTKLQDGIRLLEAKRAAMEKWCATAGTKPVNPVLLVIAQTIEGAEEVAALAKSDEFFGGRYAGAVLTVHSKAPDDALAALADVEEPDSPVRIIVSVGMLKEGWDVKNVYAICSLRPLLSDVLTEQTLGRGLRLPWGEHTGVGLLDTLEVLAHEKYEALIKKTDVINEEFVDYRTRLVVRTDPEGVSSAHVETSKVGVDIAGDGADGAVDLAEQEEREQEAAAEMTALNEELRPRDDLPPLRIPKLKMTKVELKFSLADITDLAAFESLGRKLATEPDDDLRRVELGARIVTGADGLRRTELVTTTGDRIESAARAIPLADARAHLVDAVLGAPVVGAHVSEAKAGERIVDAFLEGLGDDAERVLSSYLDTVAGSLVRFVTAEHRKFVGKPQYDEVIEVIDFAPARVGRTQTSKDRTGKFSRSVGYEGWSRSMYVQDWFDSSTERTLATILDDADEIAFWVRLNTGDLPILWQSDGREYNPDFVAVEKSGVHWLVEAKMDKEVDSADVTGKASAAQRWASHVSTKTDTTWSYLLASETAIADAHGSWSALKGLAG